MGYEMSKNKGVIILLLLIGLFFFYQSGKKGAVLEDYIFYSETNAQISCPRAELISTDCIYSDQQTHKYNICQFPKWIATTDVDYSYNCQSSPSYYSYSYIDGTELDIRFHNNGVKPKFNQIVSKDLFKGKLFRANIQLVPTGHPTGAEATLNIYIGNQNLKTPIFYKRVSTIEESGLLEILPDLLDLNMIDVYWQGEFYGRFNLSNIPKEQAFLIIDSATSYDSYVRIINPRFKYPFGCEVENDEVVIRDRYLGASTINIHSLTYEPVKFCLDSYPAVLRSFEAQGVQADIKGEITRALARGEDINIPENTELSIHYIADYKEGMTERCPIDSAYDIKTKICVKVISEAPDIIEIIREKEFVNVSKNQMLFINYATIGDRKISSTPMEYLCGYSATAPNPRSDCWRTSVSYEGGYQLLSDVFIDNEEKDLTKNFRLKFYAKGYYNEGGYENGERILPSIKNEQRQFLLTIKDFSDIKLTPITSNISIYVNLHNKSSMEFYIENNLANFNENQAGFLVKTTKDLVFSEQVIRFPKSLPLGKNKISLDVDTSQLGGIIYTVHPYFMVNNEIFTDDDVLKYNFNIVFKTPSQTEQELKAEISNLSMQLIQLKLLRDELANNIILMKTEINLLNESLKSSQTAIIELQSQLTMNQQTINELKLLLSQSELKITELQKLIMEKQQKIDLLIQESLKQEQQIQLLLANLAEKERILNELGLLNEEQKAELERLKQLNLQYSGKINELLLLVENDQNIINNINSSNTIQTSLAIEIMNLNEELQLKVLELEANTQLEQEKAEELKQGIITLQLKIQELEKQNLEQQLRADNLEELRIEQQELITKLNQELQNIPSPVVIKEKFNIMGCIAGSGEGFFGCFKYIHILIILGFLILKKLI